MMTKLNIYMYAFAVFLAVCLTSCENILDVDPQGKLTYEQYWSSKDQAIAAIAGIYSKLNSTEGMSATKISPVESYIFWGEMRGELVTNNSGKYPADQITKENISNICPTPSDVTTKFTQFYSIINGCNQAIQFLPGVRDKDPTFSQDDEKHLLGEAYFCRAFCYFWLVRTFKEVPLVILPSMEDDQNYSLPKSPMNDIFTQITSDLETAKDILPLWYDREDYSRCRATRYTALTVLSDVYLWMAAMTGDASLKTQYYEKVDTYCTEVINSKKYVLLPGVRFAEIFREGTTSEAIFESYANARVNNQTNHLYEWCTRIGYFLVPVTTDALFLYTELADYRSATPPNGTTGPEAGTAVSIFPASRYINKYNKNTNDPRWIHYRYPEVLLMKAEALAHKIIDDPYNLSLAAELIHQIRARAYGVSTYPKITVSTTYEMDELILDERGREFIGEGKRWFELVRFAARDNFAHTDLLTSRLLGAVSGVEQLTLLPRIINPEAWYLPLNSEALASNSQLIQNPYY